MPQSVELCLHLRLVAFPQMHVLWFFFIIIIGRIKILVYSVIDGTKPQFIIDILDKNA